MPYRELPVVLREKAKVELHEDPDRIPEDLQHIKDWLNKQPHLSARIDDQWLLSFLRGCKFSLERTKEKLDLFYTVKTILPEFFKDRDPFRPEIQAVLEKGILLPLSKAKDPLAPSIILIRTGMYDPAEISVTDVTKTNIMWMDIGLLENDIARVNGIHVLQDCAGFTLGHVMGPSFFKKAITCFQDAYPSRTKGIHFFNVPSFFETTFGIVKPMLNEKFKKRISIHGSDLTSLFKFVPKEILPKEYGGDGESVEEIKATCKKKMERYREWFLEDAKYGTNEKLRPGKPKTYDELFGIEGSFRKLTVD